MKGFNPSASKRPIEDILYGPFRLLQDSVCVLVDWRYEDQLITDANRAYRPTP